MKFFVIIGLVAAIGTGVTHAPEMLNNARHSAAQEVAAKSNFDSNGMPTTLTGGMKTIGKALNSPTSSIIGK